MDDNFNKVDLLKWNNINRILGEHNKVFEDLDKAFGTTHSDNIKSGPDSVTPGPDSVTIEYHEGYEIEQLITDQLRTLEEQAIRNMIPSQNLNIIIDSEDEDALRDFACQSSESHDLGYIAIHSSDETARVFALNNEHTETKYIQYVANDTNIQLMAKKIIEERKISHKEKVDSCIQGLSEADRYALAKDDGISYDYILGLIRYGDPDNLIAILDRKDLTKEIFELIPLNDMYPEVSKKVWSIGNSRFTNVK